MHENVTGRQQPTNGSETALLCAKLWPCHRQQGSLGLLFICLLCCSMPNCINENCLQAHTADGSGHGDTLAVAAHAVALGLALSVGELATPVLVATTIGASVLASGAGTLVHLVALVLDPGPEVALVTTTASVEGLAPGTASVTSVILGLSVATGSGHTRSEASAEETETTLVAGRDTEVLAASSDLVGVLAMLAGSDEALHHHLAEESLHAVGSEALGGLEGAGSAPLHVAAALVANTLGVADLHLEVIAGGTEVGMGASEATVRN